MRIGQRLGMAGRVLAARVLAWGVVWALASWAGLAAAGGPLYLWALHDEQGAPRGWLYGTIHVCDAACFPLPAPVRAAFAAADGLALELDPADPSLGPALARAGTLPPGQRVDRLLPAALRPRLAAALAAVGVPADSAQRLRPWLLGTLMTLQAARLAGFHTEQGVDLWLATRARERGLPLVALETVERQIAALSAGGDAAQLASLVEVIELIEQRSGPRYFGEMLAAWRRGDAAALDRLLREEMASPGMAPLLTELLDRRNAEMAGQIADRLQRGERPFVAVGAGHLGGATGLLALLARRGYRPVQVMETDE